MSSFYLPFTLGEDRINGYVEEDHEELAERLRKTLYYGKLPKTDRPSLPLTDISVEHFQETAPRGLGKLSKLQAAATARQTCMSPCSVMMGMLYAKRLRHTSPAYLQQVSSSDLFLISMMMASKFMYDEGVDDEVFNDEWAAAADMEVEDVNELERNFLSAIDWQLFVKEREFLDMLHQIEKRIALRQGTDRGWFSYTDMWVLSQDPILVQFWKQVGKQMTEVLLVSSVAYLASVLTMVGSTVALTAVSMALGSAIPTGLEPLPPLPIPNVPVLTEPVKKNDSQPIADVEKCTQNRMDQLVDATNCLPQEMDQATHKNSLLSQLFAVIALPETLMSLLYGNKKNGQSSVEVNPTQVKSLCANGPCPHHSYKNCQNVSRYNTGSACHPSSSWTDSSNSYHRCATSENCGCDMNSDLNAVWDHVTCCCDYEAGPVYSKDPYLSLHNIFSDISVGFRTGPRLPIAVGT